MEFESIMQRLRLAAAKLSLRKIGAACDLSHEKVRKLLNAKEGDKNVTVATLEKLSKGLADNGF